MKRVFAHATAIALVGFVAPLVSPVGEVRALTYPQPMGDFPQCAAAADEFCVETLEFTPTGGAKQVIATPVVQIQDRHANETPNVNVFMQGSYTGPSSISLTSMAGINFSVDNINTAQPVVDLNTPPSTAPGLGDGVYRIVIRTGDFDPTFMTLQAKFEKYSVTKGADGYFTVDISARPTPIAIVVGESQTSRVALDRCEAGQWVTNCEASFASRGDLFGALMMGPTAEMRDAMRGLWVASNASTLSLGPPDLAKGTIEATAKGPHFVPADFGIPNLVKENGRDLNPAHFEMGVPLTMVAAAFSRMTSREITVEQVKTLLANPTEVLEGSISELPSGATSVTEKTQNLTVSLTDDAMRVNFNLTHFSAPNPKLKLKAPEATTGGTPAATRLSRKLSNGVTLKIARTATKGRTVTGKNLVQPSSGGVVTKVVSRTKSVCVVQGTSVRMVKTGTCKASVTVRRSGKSSTTSISLAVS